MQRTFPARPIPPASSGRSSRTGTHRWHEAADSLPDGPSVATAGSDRSRLLPSPGGVETSEARSRVDARATRGGVGWGDGLSVSNSARVERSPHPVSHYAALHVSRPTSELRSSRSPPGEGKETLLLLRLAVLVERGDIGP